MRPRLEPEAGNRSRRPDRAERVHQRRPRDAILVVDHDLEADDPAPVVPDQHGLVNVEVIQHANHVRRQRRSRDRPRRLVRLAVAAACRARSRGIPHRPTPAPGAAIRTRSPGNPWISSTGVPSDGPSVVTLIRMPLDSMRWVSIRASNHSPEQASAILLSVTPAPHRIGEKHIATLSLGVSFHRSSPIRGVNTSTLTITSRGDTHEPCFMSFGVLSER